MISKQFGFVNLTGYMEDCGLWVLWVKRPVRLTLLQYRSGLSLDNTQKHRGRSDETQRWTHGLRDSDSQEVQRP